MYRIRKVFKFEAAHVLGTSYSKDCQNIHGHSYIVEVFCESKTLNKDRMVIDFGLIKDVIKPIIDEWDHAIITSPEKRNDFSKYKSFTLDSNPTAEIMAEYLFRVVKNRISEVFKVRVHETATGWAEYEEY